MIPAIALTLLGSMTQAQDAPQPLAHWSFDEGQGIVARDVTGNGHDGRLEDAAWSPDGISGSALRCDGGAMVVADSDPLTPPEQLSLELWFQTSDDTQSDRWLLNTILGGDSKGYRLGFGGGRLAFQIVKTSWSLSLTAALPTPPDEWCHAVATYDGNVMRLYLNGVPVGRMDRGGPIQPSGQPLHIGTFVAGHERAFFAGRLDELKVYDRALTAQQVRNGYARLAPGAESSPVAPDWDFAEGLDGWRAWAGGLSVEGPRVRLEDATGLLLSPPVTIDAESNEWATVRLAAEHGSLLQLGWVSEKTSAIQLESVPLIADGQVHTYNIDLAASKGWVGEVSRLALRPTNAVGAEVRLVSLSVGPEPVGPAEMFVNWCGLEDPINRVGMTCRLVCHVKNLGGEALRDLRMTVDWPDTLTPRTRGQKLSSDALETGEVAVLSCLADARSAGGGRLRLTLSAANCEGVERDVAVDIGTALNVAPAQVDGRPYVPEPIPAKTDYEVGAYIFPGWKQGVHYGWQRIQPYPEKRPVLGWYREEMPEVADWWIKWGLEHGVTFFAYDWYWRLGSTSLEHGLHEAFLNAKYQHLMKFSLLWANHNAPIESPDVAEQDLMDVTDYWIENYFRRDNYLRLDGKPVVFIFSPWHFTNDLDGSENVRRVMDRMRQRCEEAGVGRLYLVFCISTGGLEVSPAEVERAEVEGWDAVSTYAWVGYARKFIPFSEVADGYKRSWQTVLDSSPLKMIAPISGGFDSRPWHDVPTIRYDRTPEEFRRHLVDAKAVLDRDDRPPSTKMAIIEAWNEWGEGAYIEPNTEWGFGYLDAIRDVFTQAPREHDDVTPRDLDLGPYDWDFTTRNTWDFDEAGDLQGWGGMMGLTDVRAEGGALRATTTTRDSAFSVACDTDAREYPYVLVTMSIDRGTGGQLFWSGDRVRESEQASIHFELVADGLPHDYLLPVGENKLWRGKVTRLRFDANDEAGAQVAIDSVRLLREKP